MAVEKKIFTILDENEDEVSAKKLKELFLALHKDKEKDISEYSSACYSMENTNFRWKDVANMTSAR